MTSDGNRGATLTYNYLNLPKTVVINSKTLAYDYDAAGTKHRYATDTLTIKYAGPFEYNASNNFSRLALSEGQALFRKDTLRFDYYLKDHLGNVRIVFDEKGKILQQTDYYPFGLEISRDTPASTHAARNGANRYLYNGKESQVGTGYVDYGARMDMPEIGRWGVVDPISEKYYHDSSCVYARDNPVVNIDPFGMDWYKAKDGSMQYDPNIKSKKDVGEGQTYVGQIYKDKTDNGTVKYRKDSSIMYSDQTDAYNRIASNSTHGTTHEESAAILKDGVLVLPSYDNNSTTADPGKYGYKFEGGNLVDAVDGKTKNLVAMVHTHPDKGGEASPSYLNLGGGSGASFGGKNIPGKMNFVLDMIITCVE